MIPVPLGELADLLGVAPTGGDPSALVTSVVADSRAVGPGALFVAYVVPLLVRGGTLQWVGAVATLAVMAATRSIGWAIAAGVAAAWVVWLLAA